MGDFEVKRIGLVCLKLAFTVVLLPRQSLIRCDLKAKPVDKVGERHSTMTGYGVHRYSKWWQSMWQVVLHLGSASIPVRAWLLLFYIFPGVIFIEFHRVPFPTGDIRMLA